MGLVMHLGTKIHLDSGTIDLQRAVLCVDCESVSDSRGDECPICGSHSIFRIAPVLGGSLLTKGLRHAEEDGNTVTFNLEIRISLKEMKARDVTAILKGVTSLISSKLEDANLNQANASLHVDVVPVTKGSNAFQDAA